MKISSRTRYAMRTVLDLAIHKDAGVARVADIARRQQIPQKFLEQILLALRGGGIVASKRGAKGGYFLARAPEAISLAAIVKLTEESLIVPGESSKGELDGDHAFEEVWASIHEFIVEKLDGVTIKDMCERTKELSSSGVWEYTI